MYEGHSVAAVVPAYNEEGYVGRTIRTLPTFVDRVYVIDDGSTDGTWAEIERYAAAENATVSPEAPGFESRVVPISHGDNRGVGGAIKTGYLRALEDGIDVTAVLGGDNQMDPDELPRYLDPIVSGAADYAKGSRFLRPEDWADMPRFRLVGNVLLSYLTKAASGYWTILDPQNGYTAISRRALERVPIEEMYEYYGYCNDLLVKLNVENLRVADVPRSSTFAYDDGWKSHIEYREYVPRVSWMLLGNFFYRMNRKYLFRDFHPLAIWYYVGIALLGVGVGLVGLGLGDRRQRGRGAAMLAGALGAVLFATVLDAEDNRDLEMQIHDRSGPDAAGPPREQSEEGSQASTAADRSPPRVSADGGG